jgi:hypothetical protein
MQLAADRWSPQPALADPLIATGRLLRTTRIWKALRVLSQKLPFAGYSVVKDPGAMVCVGFKLFPAASPRWLARP